MTENNQLETARERLLKEAEIFTLKYFAPDHAKKHTKMAVVKLSGYS